MNQNKHDYIHQQKNENENDFNQMLLLDINAYVVESCDTLFTTSSLKSIPTTKWSPFIESIFSYLATLESGTPEILFSRVEQPLPELQGFYDFTFAPLTIREKKYILWTIYDYTTLYKELQRNQQRRHELEIQRQNLNNKIHNIVVKNLNLRSKKGVSKVKTPLLLQANDVLLKNVFSNLDNLSKVIQSYTGEFLIQSFSLEHLLKSLKEEIKTNEAINIEYTIKPSLNYQLIGGVYNLKYILYELISLNNQKSTILPKIDVQITENIKGTILLSFVVCNPYLELSNEELKQLQSEISLSNSTNPLFHLTIILKLISLQNGQLQSIVNDNHQTILTFTQSFRIADN